MLKGRIAPEGYENLVFATRNNKPTQQFLVQEYGANYQKDSER